MGARVAAEVASNSSLTTNFVYGVACLSYPLHPPRKTSELRVSPLLHLGVSVLFISGKKDPSRIKVLQDRFNGEYSE